MEKAKRTISKLFAVVALVLTIALCCALFGCGEKNGNGGMVSAPSGLYIKAELEEREAYDIDDITVELIYGVDIDYFNEALIQGSRSQYYEEFAIYVCAYNTADYFYEQNGKKTESIDHKKLYYSLKELDKGDAKDGAILIDEIPYSYRNGIMIGGELMYADEQTLNVDNLKGTEYECIVNYDPYTITCFKHATVSLPVELFDTDEGCIHFGILAFGQIYNELGVHTECSLWSNRSIIPVRFDYEKDGNSITLSNVKLGSECIIDGTASLR